MKKRIVVVAFITGLCSFAALSFIGQEKPREKVTQDNLTCKFLDERDPIASAKKETFFLGVRPRFLHTLTKEHLTTVRELEDLLPKDAPKLADAFYNVKLGVFQNGEEVIVESENQEFNSSQLELLSTADYSGDIHVYANYEVKKSDGQVKEDYLSYYITVTPEKEAELNGGMESITDFIRKECKKEIASVHVDQLMPGKIEFVVSKAGILENYTLLESSGNERLDSKILDALRQFKGNWVPAQNAKGEKIEQLFVLSFGLQGC